MESWLGRRTVDRSERVSVSGPREHVAVEIPPIWLRPDPIDPDTQLGVPTSGPEVGFRHRIGGEPPLLAGPQPVCTSCRQKMTFYGQLDSVNAEVRLADVGLVAVYVCFDCFESTSMVVSS